MRQVLSLCKLEQVLEAHMAAWTCYAALGKQSHMRVPGIPPSGVGFPHQGNGLWHSHPSPGMKQQHRPDLEVLSVILV